MANLICFPHYTCGGLLCDILNQKFSSVTTNGGLNSVQHSIGKIGDTDTIFTNYDPNAFIQRVSAMEIPDESWIGTHCWPGRLPLEHFGKVLVVTTTTYKSKIYRWARAYYHYFAPQWHNLTGIGIIDKARETAKNYIIPFEPLSGPNIQNLEFADVVETTQEFCQAVDFCDYTRHIDRWRDVNAFLYKQKFWQSDIVNYYYQAEFEVNLGRYYVYNFK
jgi:hypothetical protein